MALSVASGPSCDRNNVKLWGLMSPFHDGIDAECIPSQKDKDCGLAAVREFDRLGKHLGAVVDGGV